MESPFFVVLGRSISCYVSSSVTILGLFLRSFAVVKESAMKRWVIFYYCDDWGH